MATPQDWDAFEREYAERIAHGIATIDPGWTVTNYHGHQTRDGVAWVASLRWQGKVVASLEDDGRGGAVRADFWIGDTRDRETEARFLAESSRVFGDGYNVETMIEALLQRAGK